MPIEAITHSTPSVRLLVVWGGAVSLLAALLAGTTGLVVGLLGTGSMLLLWMLTSAVAALLPAGPIPRRMVAGLMVRTLIALSTVALAVRFYGVDARLACWIALLLYIGLLACEVAAFALAARASQRALIPRTNRS